MKLVGNILLINNKREDKHHDIELHIDRVEYITNKKDGKYLHPIDFEDTLDTPLIITGDCLSRKPRTTFEENEYDFNVYDLVDGEYILNPDKELSVQVAYDFESDLNIMSSLYYAVNVSNDVFKQLKSERHKTMHAKRGKGRR